MAVVPPSPPKYFTEISSICSINGREVEVLWKCRIKVAQLILFGCEKRSRKRVKK